MEVDALPLFSDTVALDRAAGRGRGGHLDQPEGQRRIQVVFPEGGPVAEFQALHQARGRHLPTSFEAAEKGNYLIAYLVAYLVG